MIENRKNKLKSAVKFPSPRAKNAVYPALSPQDMQS